MSPHIIKLKEAHEANGQSNNAITIVYSTSIGHFLYHTWPTTISLDREHASTKNKENAGMIKKHPARSYKAGDLAAVSSPASTVLYGQVSDALRHCICRLVGPFSAPASVLIMSRVLAVAVVTMVTMMMVPTLVMRRLKGQRKKRL
jgi:hypothetical protein